MRYDAELKHFPELLQFVQQQFNLIAVCPEVEIGLSVPRPPVQLVQQGENLLMLGRDDPELDITPQMQHYCTQRGPQLNSIHGYIFKSRSPSCGVSDTPIFNQQGEANQLASGLFAQHMLQHYPQLPITDEESLASEAQRSAFAQRVKHYRQSVDTL